MCEKKKIKMELVNGGGIEMLSRRSIVIKDYELEDDEEESGKDEDADRTSLKIDLSMAEQFYYEVISSFQKEEVVCLFRYFLFFFAFNSRCVRVCIIQNIMYIYTKTVIFIYVYTSVQARNSKISAEIKSMN